MLTRYARYVSQVLGEQVLAELREDFVANTLALPIGIVESAGSGDLLTRTGRDVEQLGWSVRWALPEWTIALVTAVRHRSSAALSVGLVGRDPLPARRTAAGDRAALVPRPRQGRLPARERVVLPDQRHAHRDRRRCAHGRGARLGERADRRPSTTTSGSRTPPSGTPSTCARCSSRAWSSSYLIPTVVHPAARWLPLHAGHGLAGRGHRGHALRADADRPGRPDRLDPRRAPARRGLARPAARRGRGARRPRRHRRAPARRGAATPRTCGSPTSRGATCCTASTSTSRRGSGSRWSDPPAPASRRSAGCSRASTRRGPAPSRSAASAWSSCRSGDLRGHVALVTQEHHVFVGTLRENLALAAPPGATDERHPGGPGRGRRADWVERAARRTRHRGRLGRPRARPTPRPSSSRSRGWCWPTRTRWCSTRRPR